MRFGFNLFVTDPAELHSLAIACDETGWDHLSIRLRGKIVQSKTAIQVGHYTIRG